MKTLGGSTFVWNGIKQDYNFIETLECLYELCDEVSVACGGDDGTVDMVISWIKDKTNFAWTTTGNEKSYFRYVIDGKTILVNIISKQEWDSQKGREKLSYFSNIAIAMLSTDWNFYLQCDEILHEESFPFVRQAIEHDVQAYFCRRLNLWRDPWHMLNVPQDRKPCSTEVIRLARTKYRCVDDAESLGVPDVHIFGDIDLIQIFHMGFVRDPVKHLEKIRHMQTEVFLWGDYDEKAKNCDQLQPDRWFDPEKDLIPIPRPLPKFIRQWCEERYPNQ